MHWPGEFFRAAPAQACKRAACELHDLHDLHDLHIALDPAPPSRQSCRPSPAAPPPRPRDRCARRARPALPSRLSGGLLPDPHDRTVSLPGKRPLRAGARLSPLTGAARDAIIRPRSPSQIKRALHGRPGSDRLLVRDGAERSADRPRGPRHQFPAPVSGPSRPAPSACLGQREGTRWEGTGGDVTRYWWRLGRRGDTLRDGRRGGERQARHPRAALQAPRPAPRRAARWGTRARLSEGGRPPTPRLSVRRVAGAGRGGSARV